MFGSNSEMKDVKNAVRIAGLGKWMLLSPFTKTGNVGASSRGNDHTLNWDMCVFLKSIFPVTKI